MLLSLLNSHSTGTSVHSGTCMNERTHNLKASVPQGGLGVRTPATGGLLCSSLQPVSVGL
jgi:hypothetical protein